MKRILVVEDEDVIRDFVVINLRRAGYEVTEVPNGEAALQVFEETGGNFDVAVLDIMMPGLDGVEVLRRLRRERITTPALFLTAKSEVEQRVEGLDAGADELLWGVANPSDAVLDMWNLPGKDRSREKEKGRDSYAMYVRIMKSVAEIMNGAT